jgi:hypothetical protein
VADCVNVPIAAVKLTAASTAIDLVSGVAKIAELPTGHNAVLSTT